MININIHTNILLIFHFIGATLVDTTIDEELPIRQICKDAFFGPLASLSSTSTSVTAQLQVRGRGILKVIVRLLLTLIVALIVTVTFIITAR